MPSVAAVLGCEPPELPASTRAPLRSSGLGSTMTVLVVWLQAATSSPTTVVTYARVCNGPSCEKVGPNVVFAPMASKTCMGFIETIRVREGRLPWLGHHLARLRASITAL